MKVAPRKPNVLLWTLVFGVVFNVLGWLGNNIVLGPDWAAASVGVKAGFAAPWPSLVREAVSLVSDFIYAFAMVWMFSNAREKTAAFAVTLAFVVWLAGAALTYLVLVNSGFLPLMIAAKTSLLALGIFLAAAPILAMVIRD